jgi:hypothetical protein
MRKLNFVMLISVMVALGFLFTGCGNAQKIMSEMSGTWKSDKGNAPVTIHLDGKQKAIEIGGNSVPVTVNKVDETALLVKLDAKPANGKAAVWSLREVRSENGSTFTIKFGHDGQEETLSRG